MRPILVLTFLLASCAAEQVTTNGHEGDPCAHNEDCEAGLACDSGACWRLCNADVDCDRSEQHCDDGVCVEGAAAEDCGDGDLRTGEACDDGNLADLDGCNSDCEVETGYTCTGNPSDCELDEEEPVPGCGDGVLDTGETCDDDDSSGTDGCSSTCQVEPGYTCTGTPSTCACLSGLQDNDHDGDCTTACGTAGGPACTGNSVCSDAGGTAACTCIGGYTGPTCSDCAAGYQDNDDDNFCLLACTPASCTGHASCSDASGTIACSCDTGYTGATCSTCDSGYQDRDGNTVCSPDCATALSQGLTCVSACSDETGTATCGNCVLRADDLAAAGGDGLTWATPFNDLTNAIGAAVAHIVLAHCTHAEIWAQAGEYLSPPGNEELFMHEDVDLYGGFAGTETWRSQRVLSSDPAQRTWLVEESQGGGFTNDVVRFAPHSRLDGVTVRGGYITGIHGFGPLETFISNVEVRRSVFQREGWAIMVSGYGFDVSDLTISDSRLVNNYGYANVGAGILAGSVDLTIRNTIIADTFNTNGDGALDVDNSTVLIEDSVFSGNAANTGAAAIHASTPPLAGAPSLVIRRSVFAGNQSGSSAAAILAPDFQSVLIESSIFIGNRGVGTGGAVNVNFGQITNCTFSQNFADDVGCYTGRAVFANDPAGSLGLVNDLFVPLYVVPDGNSEVFVAAAPTPGAGSPWRSNMVSQDALTFGVGPAPCLPYAIDDDPEPDSTGMSHNIYLPEDNPDWAMFPPVEGLATGTWDSIAFDSGSQTTVFTSSAPAGWGDLRGSFAQVYDDDMPWYVIEANDADSLRIAGDLTSGFFPKATVPACGPCPGLIFKIMSLRPSPVTPVVDKGDPTGTLTDFHGAARVCQPPPDNDLSCTDIGAIEAE